MSGLRFPIFIDLQNKPVVVVGGGKIGTRRAIVLRDFGACVMVIDPVSAPIEGTEHLRRTYEHGDLMGASLCVAATDNRQVNRAVGEEAKSLGVPVSVADAQNECDYFFPAVCVGDNIVAGVVSDGGDHHKTARVAKEIRRILEEN